MLLEIHMIKNYPPTNLNRDDTGSPKTCLFGGIQRGRISSQCLKHSWRQSKVLRDELNANTLGIRTRKLPGLVGEKLECRGVDKDYIDIAKEKITGIGNKDGKTNDKGITDQIMFFSQEDISKVADLVQEEIKKAGSVGAFKKLKAKDWQKMMKDAKTRPITLDIALFGRMVTSDAFADVEAAMQVAHAISTHAVNQENDFFTAVDDLVSGGEGDDSGAGMIGDIEYNSCCYYMYAAIDIQQLKDNLMYSDEASKTLNKALPALIRAMAFSNPSGKQNSFAGHVLPDVVCVEVKEKKIPVSYVNAFVKPAVSGYGKDLVEDSIAKLTTEIDSLERNFGIPVKNRLWFCRKELKSPENAEKMQNFNALIDSVKELLFNWIEGNIVKGKLSGSD